ncbi:glycosyltransferase [Arsenicicoccus piscis]|uniref:D-inositol 3-phosphate glycosyltransferase n=1 Tax=Arsenicicoccus piscis TaxID=673954 RepID=A0ABQ6HTD7_9MICO|nr:glycosyltransferase [Arsenicicoccus piscis]GMA21778.1 GDP-mannose-dependent alpha-mannosyltransferase [Arsenicicoccus piscis]
MKVLVIAESWPPAMNGVASSSLRLVTELRDRGHHTKVIAPTTLESPGRAPSSHDRHDPRDLVSAKAVRVGPTQEYTVGIMGGQPNRLLETWRPDVVHVASPLSLGWAGLRAARRHDVPAVAAYLTDFTAFTRQSMRHLPGGPAAAGVLGRAQRAAHSLAAVNIACSRYALGTLHDWGSPTPREWLRAVDGVRFTPQRRRRALARRAAEGRTSVRIGYAGRLAAEKELELLASVADLPDVELMIVGDGPRRARLAELLPRARFTGRLGGEDYADTVASFDLFVHPGRGETLSQVVLEAVALGIPCVVPATGTASSELVTPGVGGAHFRGGDGADLRETVERLLPTLPRGPEPIAAGVRHRTWEGSMTSLLDAYDEAIERHHAAAGMALR